MRGTAEVGGGPEQEVPEAAARIRYLQEQLLVAAEDNPARGPNEGLAAEEGNAGLLDGDIRPGRGTPRLQAELEGTGEGSQGLEVLQRGGGEAAH